MKLDKVHLKTDILLVRVIWKTKFQAC